MINLFEKYTENERDLEHSLKQANQENLTIVLNENGFLPSHVESPIGFFTGMDRKKKTSREKGRFFNNLKLPARWEIRGSGYQAEIFEGYQKKGTINYSQRRGDYRLIESVEWLNDYGKIRAIDLYNQNGLRFGRESYSDGEHVLTSYFDSSGREVVMIHHIFQTIQVYYEQKKYIFSDYISFILFYLEIAQIPVERILYNSLYHPYFVTQALQERFPEKVFSHILFWQEESQLMPGNMKDIFSASQPSTKHVVVQNKSEFERLRSQIILPTNVEFSYLGYLYYFKKEANLTPRILIHTNSDQLEALSDLLQNLPEFEFHISARTEMSQKLSRFEEVSNVSLYPNITSNELEKLLSKASFYLDINHGSEIDDIVKQAFEYNLLIFSFTQRLHNSRMVAPNYVFDETEVTRLIETIKMNGATLENYLGALKVQKTHAGQVGIEDYEEVVG